jgi:hypothetical protein
MIIGMRDEDREVVMDYEQQATQWANAGSGSAGNAAAITFAVLHLAEQVERSSIKDLVMPNAKDVWIVGLIVCLLGAIFTRRGSKAVGILAMVVGAGLVIFNTTGASSMMQNIAHSVL